MRPQNWLQNAVWFACHPVMGVTSHADLVRGHVPRKSAIENFNTYSWMIILYYSAKIIKKHASSSWLELATADMFCDYISFITWTIYGLFHGLATQSKGIWTRTGGSPFFENFGWIFGAEIPTVILPCSSNFRWAYVRFYEVSECIWSELSVWNELRWKIFWKAHKTWKNHGFHTTIIYKWWTSECQCHVFAYQKQ